MGWGVGDGETFEALLEERLNREPVSTAFKGVELMNYGIPGYQPPGQLAAFERALELQPNAVMFIATGREISRSADYLAEVVHKRLPIPYPALAAIVERSGATAGMEQSAALKLLQPHAAEILRVVYGLIAQRSIEKGIRPVWVFLPQVREGSWQEETPETVRIATEAGFAIINLADVYAGRDKATLRLAEWDDHPNVLGHRLVADALYRALAEHPETLFAVDPVTR
jgi:hypothetical protein